MSFILNYSDFLNEVVLIPARKKTDKPTEEKKPDQEVQENPNTSSDTQQPNKFFIGGGPIPISYSPKKPEIHEGHPNNVFRLFGGNVLDIRNFLQDLFPGQNLSYLGAGMMGLAFEPSGNSGLSLSSAHMQEGFTGKQPDISNVVIKITTNLEEAKTIKKLIQDDGGKSSNLAHYYWIKEINLPSEQQFSSTIRPPAKSGMTKRDRWELAQKIETKEWWDTPDDQRDDFKLSDKQRKKAGQILRRRIERKKKKGEIKWTKIYVICLERLIPLTQVEKDYLMFAFMYYGWAEYDHQPREKESNKPKYFKPISVLRNIYLKDEIMRDWWIKKIHDNYKSKEQIKNVPDIEQLKVTFSKLLDAIEKVWQGKYTPEKLDLHVGNIGYRNGELVFFDPFA